MSFYSEIITPILGSIERFASRNAFCIDEEFYTYAQLGQCVKKVRRGLERSEYGNSRVGLVINDDLETYASIIALWMQGDCYVPLHPGWPLERCRDICKQVGLDLIVDSSKQTRFQGVQVLNTGALGEGEDFFYAGETGALPSAGRMGEGDWRVPREGVSDGELAYIMFTSGSTGRPKGVQLSRGNLASFVEAFFEVYKVDENDKCLQCFDLSFDLSIMSYLIPLLRGACVYTVPSDVIKYSFIGGLIEEEGLTVALMAPSTIKYLKPYFGELDCSSLRLSLFCGEALPLDEVEGWAACAGNATIDNVYGPTENTIFCSYYRYNREGENRTYNGILSIGKPMKGTRMAIFDEKGEPCPEGTLGELCLSGDQLTTGYHKNEEKNRESFFLKEGERWYRTGDLCFKDDEGYFLFSGRMDQQAKIQGFRVELGEIEYHAREFLGDTNVVCIAFDNKEGLAEIAMFIECEEFVPDEMTAYMRTKMPSYMIPAHFFFVPQFPLNANGKTDKVKLKLKIEN